MTIAIVAVLVSLLVPAAGSTLAAARGFKCQMTMRSVAFDFAVFADEEQRGSRGEDDRDPLLGGRQFHLETFQESQYGIDEFWAYGDSMQATMPDSGGADPMRCAAVWGDVHLLANTPCAGGAVQPAEHVSYTFNMRLHRAEVVRNGMLRFLPALLTSAILQEGDVPLLWDVDGSEAARRDPPSPPVLSAPSLDSVLYYADDRYWYPAMRHGGAMNVAFVGGHVLTSRDPLDEPGWRWDYQPLR